jgi:hypothetical protein
MAYNYFFPDYLDTRHLADGRNMQGLVDFRFLDPVEGTITAMAGDITDMASIPRPFWIIIPPFGRYLFGAVIHDKLYRTQLFGETFSGWRRADRVLWRAMKFAPIRVSVWTRGVIYVGLLLGGWVAYFRVWDKVVAILTWKRKAS